MKTIYQRSMMLVLLSGSLLTASCKMEDVTAWVMRLKGGGQQQGQSGPPGQGKPGGPPPMPSVSFVVVQPQRVELTAGLPGRTSPYRAAEIRPQVSGIIQKRLFTEGADVKAGEALYQIDPAPFQAALDNAEASLLASRKAAERARAALKAGQSDLVRLRATLSLARSNSQRAAELFKSKVNSAVQRDQAATEVAVAEATLAAAEAQVESSRSAIAAAEASVQQAEAAVKTARINLGYTKVTAPISGRIGISSVTEGAVVTAYQAAPLATVQQLDPIYADMPQAAAKLLQLRGGGFGADTAGRSSVRLLLENGAPYPLDGVLQFSDVTVDQTTGSVLLRAVFPNPEGQLLPGMFVRTVIQEGVREQALLVPQQGVSRNPKGDPFALVVGAENKVEMRMLTIERAVEDKWLVSKGLAPGDKVIVEGLVMLRPGAAVNAVPFGEKPQGGGAAEKGNQQSAQQK
ncbi:efflux RND transporter periplasmic adaptor subunit [Candidatus Electronema sp. JC]|uniref:efflux RND transporter periplasmic adaptor subunit n=1 Tax=Candidatus Electronema sp. JC TaxID=3401570 RepID=UPI003B43A983